MSQGLGAVASASALPSENNANSATSATSSSAWAPKLRSCVVCRSRKVRCDKRSPCSNCRRANIACVFPSTDRPPKWARRLERITNSDSSSTAAKPASSSFTSSSQTATEAATSTPIGQADRVMDRLRNLEGLVKELRSQLEQANTAVASSTGAGSSGVDSPESSSIHGRDTERQTSTSPATSTAGMQQQQQQQHHVGRLVPQHASRSRYVSSGFWSRVKDELDELEMDSRGLALGDSDTSDDEESPGETPSTQELGRMPADRHAFLFRHNLGGSAPDLREFRPLPSQIPFLLNVYSENVNFVIKVVHMPTVTKMTGGLRRPDVSSLTLANEALMFSIYYGAVTSMEEDDVMTNFGSSKAELNLKYRLGFEHALAKADFLNVPDLALVQAFTIFLCLARRHDSPRYVWMMTGLVIRMAHALGLQRDGSHFPHLTPFEVEMRRRVWYALCALDVRASEDQGTDLSIASDSYDTKLPLNINDGDIEPETKVMPQERQGLTDITIALAFFVVSDDSRRMMAPRGAEEAPSLDEQVRMLNTFYAKLEQRYLQYATESGNIAYWVAVTVTRLVVSKMTLIIYLPALFSSPSEHFSDEIRDKLLVAAIEVAEYNHALNAEQDCRQWRWIYQTYTHWYAIVYLLIETSRREWKPTVERAWIALHSSWLIPRAQPNMDKKNFRIWVPLRKLMAKARKHREAELQRLRGGSGDTQTIERLETEDRKMPVPASSGPFPAEKGEELFRQYWRSLVTTPAEHNSQTQVSGTPHVGRSHPSIGVQVADMPQQGFGFAHSYGQHDMGPNTSFGPASEEFSQGWSNTSTDPNSTMAVDPQDTIILGKTEETSYSNTSLPTVPADWSGGRSIGPGFTSWLLSDPDPTTADAFAGVDVGMMDVDGEVNWHNWLESAKNMELDAAATNGAGGKTGLY